MKRYVIERNVPGIGGNDAAGFCNISKTSNAALKKLATRVQWEHSYVTGDKTFCIYLAESEDHIRQHAELSGIPLTRIIEISRIIDPLTANN